MLASNAPEKLPSMAQTDAECGEFCLGDGAEGLEVVKAGLQAVREVLLKAQICERLEEVLVLVAGSHGRDHTTGGWNGAPRLTIKVT